MVGFYDFAHRTTTYTIVSLRSKQFYKTCKLCMKLSKSLGAIYRALTCFICTNLSTIHLHLHTLGNEASMELLIQASTPRAPTCCHDGRVLLELYAVAPRSSSHTLPPLASVVLLLYNCCHHHNPTCQPTSSTARGCIRDPTHETLEYLTPKPLHHHKGH